MTRSYTKIEHINKTIVEGLYKDKNVKEVAKDIGVNHKTLRKFMKSNNIPLKSRYKYSSQNIFSENTEKSFYWAGFIAADGCVLEKGKEETWILKLALANKDSNHLFKLKEDLSATNPIKEFKNYSEISICSLDMCRSLRRFNIVPRKTHIYHMPKWLEEHPMLHHFIRGYFDGDGGFSTSKAKHKKTLQIQLRFRGTVKFLEQVHNFFDKKMESKLGTRKIPVYDNIGSLAYSGNKRVPIISEFLYKDSTLFLVRKKEFINLHLLAHQ